MKAPIQLGLGLVTLTLGAVGVLATPSISQGELSLPYINSVLDNHEARITNNEKDISALQASTNTEAAGDHVTVPVVSQASQTAGSAPTAPGEPTQTTPQPGASPEPSPTPVASPMYVPPTTPVGNVTLSN